MKIDGRAVEAFLRRPDPRARAVLLYGPDGGLVRERGQALARTVVEDLADPFRVAEFSGEALEADPARLADEAAALSMTGGRRVVRVRPCGNEAAEAFAAFLAAPMGEALIVAEASELDGRSALRRVFEAAPEAAVIACYRDEGAALTRIVRDTLAAAQVKVAPDALDWLAEHLGGDRAITRSELEKLALYVGPGATATLADAEAIVGDAADIGLDDAVWAATEGDAAALDRALGRARAEGAAEVQILRRMQAHFARLHLAAVQVAAIAAPEAVVERMRPPVFWKDKRRFVAALRRWPAPRLAAALTRLLDAEIAIKTGAPGEAVVGQCLFGLAAAGR